VNKSVFLPVFACIITVASLIYSGCSETQAHSSSDSSAAELKSEINRFGMALQEIRRINDEQVKLYGSEMGCNTQSNTLDLIKEHNELINHYDLRLEYHKLQLIQADTINTERNKAQLDEVRSDISALEKDAQEIRKGLTDFTPTHATK
jgi:outer membrane murein-binding lipoprotein Lpp